MRFKLIYEIRRRTATIVLGFLLFCMFVLFMLGSDEMDRAASASSSAADPAGFHSDLPDPPAEGGQEWKSFNPREKDVPANLLEYSKDDKAAEIKIEQKSVNINDKTIQYLDAQPASVVENTGKSVLLLHGEKYSMDTWRYSIKTIQFLSAAGYHVVSTDIPGHGTNGGIETPSDKGEYIASIIDKVFDKSKPTVVSPSMSGSYSIPLMLNKPDKLCGFVAVAPVIDVENPSWSTVKVPTLIVRGQKDDVMDETSSKKLEEIPTSTKIQIFDGGSHACYLDDHDLWHKMLYNFLPKLSCT